MPAKLSVGASGDEGAQLDVYGWDWSQTTHDAKGSGQSVAEVFSGVLERLGGETYVFGGPGLQGWEESAAAYDAEGYLLGRVYHGGRTDVHVKATSAVADAVRSLVTVDRCKTARVDTRVDSLAPFDELADILERAGEIYGSQIVEISGRAGVKGDRHDTGRTVMLGAPSSALRIRLYEKWLESPGQYVEGTNRVEVQLRPPSRVKERVSSWSRAETFCASKVAREVAERLGTDLAPAASLHVSRGTPDLDRSMAAMGRQYGRAFGRYLATGGDLSMVLGYLDGAGSLDLP